MVQLGLSSLDGAPLDESAIERALKALDRMCAVAGGWKVSELIAVATSAVREAPNRREFLRRVREKTGIKIKVISGEEEADYIFRAVLSAVDFGGSTAACIDIGGGSTEFIVGTSSEIYFTASEPLGSLRLSQKFRLADRPSPEDVEACRAHVKQLMRRVGRHVRTLGIDVGIGTSGTILALAGIASPASETPTGGLRVLTRARVEEIVQQLVSLTAAERAAAFRIDEKRATTIVGGAVAIAEIMASLRLESLLACQVSMREGIVLSRLSNGRTAMRGGKSLRRAETLALAARTECDKRHARHVTHLAMRIFDQTRMIHALPDESREMLEHAAQLHEAGMHVSDRGYHKHSYYLIRHSGLRGFTEDQLVTVANIARYHRKSPPDREHTNLTELDPALRGDIEKLAAILRIADALDRSHRQAVRDVAVRCGDDVRFLVRARADAEVELTDAAKRARYFGELFEKKVRFESV
jgi:exopolyphosphatase/guanosine-5'-triphosphate,3'-diphosphate pyrophosphatase